MPRPVFTVEQARAASRKAVEARRLASDRRIADAAKGGCFGVQSQAGLLAKSNYARTTLADSIIALCNVSKDLPWKAGIDHAVQRSSLVQTIVASAAKVFGWSDSSDRPLIVVGETARVLDVKSVSCGQDTPTCGSQAPVKQMTDTTSAEVPQP